MHSDIFSKFARGAAALSFAVITPARAAFLCPDMPTAVTQIDHNIRSEIDTSVGKIGPLKAAEIKGKLDVEASNLLGKISQSERILIIQTMAATYCAMIREMPSLSDREKLDRWSEFSSRAYSFMDPNWRITPPAPPPIRPSLKPKLPSPRPAQKPSSSGSPAKQALARANAALERNDEDLAISEANEAIRLDQNLSDAYETRGQAYYFKGNRQVAIENFTDAIRINPSKSSYYDNRAIVYTGMDNYDKAILDETDAIRLNNSEWVFYFNRGVDYYNKGDFRRAIIDLRSALNLNPESENIDYVKQILDKAKQKYSINSK